jgi:hypothetical protein
MSTQGPSGGPTRRTVPERLQEFFKRLGDAPYATDPEDALSLLGRLIDEVEDEWSGIPKRENPGLVFDGRMYPLQEDFIERLPDGSLVARTRGHVIEIDRRGGIIIKSKRTGGTVFSKPGRGTLA